MSNVTGAGTKPGLDPKSTADVAPRTPAGGGGTVSGGGPESYASYYEQGIGPFVRQFLPAGIISPGEQTGLQGWLPNGYVHPEQPPGILFNPDHWFPQWNPIGYQQHDVPPAPPAGYEGPGQVGQQPGTYRTLRDCFRQYMQRCCQQLGTPVQVPWSPPPQPGCTPDQVPDQTPTQSGKPGEGPKQVPSSGDDCPTQGTYTVKRGDTLWDIGQRYGVSWQQIFAANRDKISNPDLIYPGQVFTIPCADAPSSAPPKPDCPPTGSPSQTPPVTQKPPTEPPPATQHPTTHTPKPKPKPKPKPPHHPPSPPTTPPVTQKPPTEPPPVTQKPPTEPPPVEQKPPSEPPPVTQQPPDSPVQQQPPTDPPPATVPPEQVAQSVQQRADGN